MFFMNLNGGQQVEVEFKDKIKICSFIKIEWFFFGLSEFFVLEVYVSLCELFIW